MHSWGEFQSIFQLAAALYVGISGILALWGDPLEAHRNVVSSIRARAANLLMKYEAESNKIRPSIYEFMAKCDKEIIDELHGESRKLSQFLNYLRLFSFLFGALSILLLIASSQYYKDPIANLYVYFGFALLILIILILISLLVISKGLERSLISRRNKLDEGYRDLADSVLS